VARPPLITLTTDFGLADPYVAAVKGVILSLNPDATLFDVTHAVGAQDVAHGAFLLAMALPHLPPGAIHLAVVDPGVGSERRAIALRTAAGTFVGPDNGVLSPAFGDDVRAAAPESGGSVDLPPGAAAVALTNAEYHRRPVSDTFHARDIFAPAAAHLSLGTPLQDLGEPLTNAFLLPPFAPLSLPDGSLIGHVRHVDTFGNLITDVRADDMPGGEVAIEIRGETIQGVARTYAEAGALCALFGGSGYLEIALPGGSAAAALAADTGEPVTVRPA
jgi:S-adenosylmethionine hydrolase